ncbi:helix-turn-helix domain-containing protein [Marinifilum caeruleilacunae]|uniref:AraC family transcriptional regulator n=1 Tax=Marinifilum caeruleilacunae TaxID=2499076 RepID=A0ABX1X299_9BACT|nr:AraC family transcriptional regulator [Marinifilum caeruleilacunae]NOU62213.1 AraC family transcriptional regulator [Marinifilum caeruleilacunae]
MAVENIPEIYLESNGVQQELFVYDFKMTNDVVKSKVNLSMNMFSFLQVGKKQVHFADASVMVNKDQSLLIREGNWLWTELLDNDDIYYCKLFFFSESRLKEFMKKYPISDEIIKDEDPFFVIENDEYITSYIGTLSRMAVNPSTYNENLLSIKFEEILLYLMGKYGEKFETYLYSLITKESSPFKKIIESNVFSNLKLEEIAFLCNMSLSTFKRSFMAEYGISPGKWLQDKRLQRAKEILQEGKATASDIYLDYGYSNLSNFSIAFKNKFGISPTEISK